MHQDYAPSLGMGLSIKPCIGNASSLDIRFMHQGMYGVVHQDYALGLCAGLCSRFLHCVRVVSLCILFGFPLSKSGWGDLF
jgi:hypothetical protein